MSCGKKPYQSRWSAKRWKKHLNKKGCGMTNIYFCEDCQAYHLTSMDKRESRAKQRRGTFRQIQHKELEELRESVKANTHDTHNTRSKGLT